MANVRVKDLPNANTLADADELIIDSSSAGTRRISYSELKTEVAGDYVAAPSTYKVAPLNSSNKIDATYLPTTGDTAKGGWNASTNTPTLANGTGTAGDYYDVTTAGLSLGISFSVGDVVKYDGANWFKIDSVANIFDGISTVDQVKTLAQVPDIGLQPNQVPLSGMLNSGAWLDFDAFYQTGTWTPSITFGGGSTGIAYSYQEGVYTRIGDVVNCSCIFQLSDKGSDTGDAVIAGLPFVAKSASSDIFVANFGRYANLSGLTSCVEGAILNGTSTIRLNDVGSTGSTNLQSTNFTNTSLLRFSATYQIA